VKRLFIIFLLLTISILHANKGLCETPPCAAFDSTGKDSIRAVNSYSNSLYAGIDNYIEINKKKIPFKNIIVEVERGMAMEDDGSYFVIPSKPGFTMINIYEYDKGDTNLVIRKAMKVFPVPQPYITIDKTKITEQKYIGKEKFTKNNHFEVHLSEDLIDDSNWYSIKEFTMGYPVGQQYVTKTADGNALTTEMITSIQKMMPGKELSFSFTLEGIGGMYKRIPPIRVKIY
jgi:hypothetical protein